MSTPNFQHPETLMCFLKAIYRNVCVCTAQTPFPRLLLHTWWVPLLERLTCSHTAQMVVNHPLPGNS